MGFQVDNLMAMDVHRSDKIANIKSKLLLVRAAGMPMQFKSDIVTGAREG